jgi:beta-phosphoglucomutase
MVNAAFPYPAAIFNLDGVLIDTAVHHYAAWSRLAQNLGFDFSYEQHEELRGLSRMASLERILEWGGIYLTEAEKLHMSDVKNNWYLESITQVTPANVLPGVIDFLRELKSAGIKLALSSSSKSARQVLASAALTSFFDAIVDGQIIRKGIPDPECFLLAAKSLEIDPAQCAVFEDSFLGIKAALFGGFTVVGIGQKDYLKEAHGVLPDFKDVTMEKLASILSESVSYSFSLQR